MTSRQRLYLLRALLDKGYETNLRCLLIFSTGSYDGTIRLWKLDRGFRSFARLAEIDAIGVVNSIQIIRPPLAAAVGAGWQAGAEASTSAFAGHDGEDADGEEEDSEDMLGGMFKSVDAANGTSSRRTISKIGKGTRASGEVPLVLIAAVAREPRLGRWLVMKEGVQNRAVVCVLPVLLAPPVLPGAP
jgi:ribosomal RNA-processing protein 9